MSTDKYTRPVKTQSTAAYTSNIDNAFEIIEQGCGTQFHVAPLDTPGMSVQIAAGVLFDGPGSAPTSVAATTSGAITAPSVNPRIDRVVVDATSGAISVIGGAEAASPSAPAITSGKIPLAQILLATSDTSIIKTQITDERPAWFGNVNPGTGLSSVLADTTPQLGGDLDVQTHEIISTGSNPIALHSNDDIDITLGDTAGANKISIMDSAASEVASINSDGDIDGTDLTVDKLTFATGVSATAILDEDNMASDSNSSLCTQQSIKAYVDTAASGDFKKISETTAATSTAIDFTGLSSTYEYYVAVIRNIRPTTDGQGFFVRLSTDNGSTFESSAAAYAWGSINRDSSALNGRYDDSDSRLFTAWQAVGNATNEGVTGELRIFNHDSSGQTRVTWDYSYITAAGSIVTESGGGSCKFASATDAIRFVFASGTVEDGTITLYGAVS
jgi:hypothetical protein